MTSWPYSPRRRRSEIRDLKKALFPGKFHAGSTCLGNDPHRLVYLAIGPGRSPPLPAMLHSGDASPMAGAISDRAAFCAPVSHSGGRTRCRAFLRRRVHASIPRCLPCYSCCNAREEPRARRGMLASCGLGSGAHTGDKKLTPRRFLTSCIA